MMDSNSSVGAAEGGWVGEEEGAMFVTVMELGGMEVVVGLRA